MSYRRKRIEHGAPGGSGEEISEEGHLDQAVDGDDRSRDDHADGEGSSDSEGRRMVLRSQTGKPQRKRRWTADYTDEADEDAFDDDDESGSYKGNTRKLKVGKNATARDPLPKRSSRQQNTQVGGLQYNTRGKTRGKRDFDVLDEPTPLPAAKRSNVTAQRDDDESAIASLLGLADAVDSIVPTQPSSTVAEKPAENSISKPATLTYPAQQQTPAPAPTPTQLQQLQLQHLHHLQQQQQHQQQLLLLQHQQPQQLLRAGTLPPYYHAANHSMFSGLDSKSLPFAYGPSTVAASAANIASSRAPPKPSRAGDATSSAFPSTQAALFALDSAVSALRSSKRCLAHVTIAYSAFYAQKRQELAQIMKQDSSLAAKNLLQFDLDPTSVARALKEKADQNRAALPSGSQTQPLNPLHAIMTPQQRAMLIAQQTSPTYPPQLLAGKMANFAGSFSGHTDPTVASPEDIQAIQLQLAQQYQMMHANPALLQQIAVHHPLINPFLMARAQPVPNASLPVGNPLPLTQALSLPSPPLSTDQITPGSNSSTIDSKAQKSPIGENMTTINPPTPQNLVKPEMHSQSTSELAVRSFGALLNGISASDSNSVLVNEDHPASKLADTSAAGAENPLLTTGKA